MIKHWTRPMLGGLLLLLASCGQPDRAPTNVQPLAPSTNTVSGSNQLTPNLTATTMRQTAVVIGATKEAEYLAVEQRFADETATSLAEPPYTPIPWPTDETRTPTPTWEYRLFEHLECTTDEPGRPAFITNCWHGSINGKDFMVYGSGYRQKMADYQVKVVEGGFIGIVEDDEPMGTFSYPEAPGPLTIVREQPPALVINVADQYEVLFNLETYQWTDLNGVPLVFPPTTTPTNVPTFPPLTPTP